jgi:hypothetical protein
VARYFKTPTMTPVGYRVTLPADALAAGPHSLVVRVVAADGKGYFESPKVAFAVQ